MDAHDWIFVQSSQALAFLSLIGVAMAALRWRAAVHKDLLLGFTLYLLGAGLREVLIFWHAGLWHAGVWPETITLLFGITRVVQLVGAGVFLYATVSGHYHPRVLWGLFAIFVLIIVVF